MLEKRSPVLPSIVFNFLIALSACQHACAQAKPQITRSAVEQAADAFGTRIGDESIGLYSEGQVRGISLQEAGNYRIEDAYFVRGARLLTNSVVAGSAVRIGPNALGALNLGLSTIQTRVRNAPLSAQASQLQERNLLYNAALVLPLATKLTSFATLTRGLEEPGFAPANAANRFAALAPVLSKQTELGLKWQATQTLSAIVTGFDLSKPDAGIDANNQYGYIGNVRHRGVEASLAGALNPNWTLVAGAMHMTPKLSGENVARGLIADQPVGRSAELGLLSLSYTSKPAGWSADASLNYFGRRPANAANTQYTGGNSTLALGLRYPFKMGRLPAQWRIRSFNAGNHQAWVATPNSLQIFSAPRRLDVQLILGE